MLDLYLVGIFLVVVLESHRIASHRIVSMLTKLGHRSHEVREDSGPYGNFDYDNDNESHGQGARS